MLLSKFFFFTCLLAICVSSFEKCLTQILCLFLSGIIYSVMVEFLELLMYSNPLLDVRLANIFSHSVADPFICLLFPLQYRNFLVCCNLTCLILFFLPMLWDHLCIYILSSHIPLAIFYCLTFHKWVFVICNFFWSKSSHMSFKYSFTTFNN